MIRTPKVQAEIIESLNAAIQAPPQAKGHEPSTIRAGSTQGKRQKLQIEDEDEMAGQAMGTPTD